MNAADRRYTLSRYAEKSRLHRQLQDRGRPSACCTYSAVPASDEIGAQSVIGKQERQKAYIEEGGGETFDFLREEKIMDASKKRPGT